MRIKQIHITANVSWGAGRIIYPKNSGYPHITVNKEDHEHDTKTGTYTVTRFHYSPSADGYRFDFKQNNDGTWTCSGDGYVPPPLRQTVAKQRIEALKAAKQFIRAMGHDPGNIV